MGAPLDAPRLAVFKALGDNTRYAIFLELARSPIPLATADIADSLDLHPNTIRPHLERMRDVGLLDVETEATGSVGRPQHRYSLAADAPSLGLEPPAFPVLARMLLRMVSGHDAGDIAIDAGREQGRADADRIPDDDTLDALVTQLAELGFDPAVVDEGAQATVAFTRCPFRDLAESNPEVVCGLHRGLVEGLLEGRGNGRIDSFCTLVARTPCQVELVLA